MRNEISRNVAASAFASAVLLAQGCSRQVAIEEPRLYSVEQNESDKMVVCNDPGKHSMYGLATRSPINVISRFQASVIG